MRVMQIDCEITYDGRCHTFLPRSQRLIIIKDDDTVLIHTNTKTKPINYMPNVRSISYSDDMSADGSAMLPTLNVSNLHETLKIGIYGTVAEAEFDFNGLEGFDGLQKSDSEDELQMRLASGFDEVFAPYGLGFICGEFNTGKGPVDLLGYEISSGQIALIEVKRKARRKDAYQVLRYRNGIAEKYAMAKSRGEDSFEAKPAKKIDDGISDDPKELPVEAMSTPLLFLVSGEETKGVAEECAENGITYIVTDILKQAKASKQGRS
jgi:RecB family endonuclease NucS